MGAAAMGIHPRFGRPVDRDEALDHVRRCREAGLVHLVGRNRLDTVWLGVGPPQRNGPCPAGRCDPPLTTTTGC